VATLYINLLQLQHYVNIGFAILALARTRILLIKRLVSSMERYGDLLGLIAVLCAWAYALVKVAIGRKPRFKTICRSC
jgi:hypothetical protein